MNQGAGESMFDRLLKAGETLVFSEENFGGMKQIITADIPILESNFPVASLQMGPKTGVTVFAEEDYQGLSQELTAEMASFAGSRLMGQKPKSIKIWSIVGKPFTGYWAISVAEGRYLSVGPDQVLTTNTRVTESESFRIKQIGETPGTVAFSVRGIPNETSLTEERNSEQHQALSIDNFERVALSNEPESGFRKFSLLSPDDQWIRYNPDDDRFYLTANYKDRAIFCQSIKIAENEAQVGELVHGEVALYENPAYWGKVWVFYTDYADFENVVDLNDAVSSIQLGPLTGATIYREAQFKAEDSTAGKQDVTSNLPSLEKEQVGEDQISSMDLWRIVPPEGSGVSFTCKLSQDFRGSGNTFEEYSAYRTSLRLPPTVQNVELWTTDETDIEIDGKTYHVTEDKSVPLKPNLMQRLVITSNAVGSSGKEPARGCLRAPGLKIHTDTMLPDERIVIHPDQEVHDRLSNLKADELWNAEYTDDKGAQQSIIKDRSPQKQTDVANAQSMITKVMSTVKYKSHTGGGWDQTISPEGLQGKSWALDFTTYRVKARTLYVREGPGMTFEVKDYLKWNDVVEVLGYNVAGDWIHIRRITDGLIGWSSSKFLSRIERSRREEQYRVTAKNVNVRKGPGVEFSSLGHLDQDELVTAAAVDDTGSWRRIRRSNGQEGWSYAKFLTLVQPEPESASLAFALPDSSAGVVTPTPSISGLPSSVNFHEISQEEVQALLARTEFPEADLAQSWLGNVFKAIANGVKSAVSIVVTAVKDAWAVIIDLGKQVVTWIIDTAEKAVACVEGIIEKIGAVIEEIIKWLRLIFSWGDILQTRDYLCDSINNTLDYMGEKVLEAKEPVRRFFKEQKHVITQGFDQVIQALGGSSTNPSSGSPSGFSDVVEVVDWILSKVLGGLAVFNTSSIFDIEDSDEAKNLTQFWRGPLAKGIGVFSALPEALSNIITSLVKHPDEPQLAVITMLEMLSHQINNLLEFGEEIVLGLFDLTSYLIKKIKAILKADIRIPFISDLIEWVGKLLGKDWTASLGFSLLDVATLIMAIPVTVVSKIRLGTAPFKNVPALAASVDAWSITAGVAGFLGGLVSIPLDMTPESEAGLGPLGSVLETFSLVFAITNTMASWVPDIVAVNDTGQDRSNNQPDFWWRLLLGYETSVLLLDILSFVYGFKKSKQVERFKRDDNGTIIIASALGLIHLTLLIVKDRENLEDILPDCLTTLPEICSALRLSKNPYVSVAFGIVDGIAADTALITGIAG